MSNPAVTITGRCWNGKRSYSLDMQQAISEAQEELKKLDQIVGWLKEHKVEIYHTAVFGLAVMTLPYTMGMSGGKNIILLLQKASFWVGMGITIWGIVEAQLDFPGWKGRILKGVLGYIGILLVPLVFLELQGSLQVDVWEQIDKGINP